MRHVVLKTTFILFVLINTSPVSLKFCILSLIFVNGPQALYINPGCLKWISGINISPVNKKLLNYFIHFLYGINLSIPCQYPTKEILFKRFISKLINNPQESNNPIKALFLRISSLKILDFYFLYFSYTSNNITILFYMYTKSFD